MECQHINELLPWLVNGTLGAEEQRHVKEHLARCEACRRELQEMIWVLNAAQQHVPADALVDYAFARPTPTVARDLIERHLQSCSACAEQLEAARESRNLLEEERATVPSGVVERAGGWAALRRPYTALVANLLGFLVIGGWLWHGQQATKILQIRLEAEMQRLQQTESQILDEQRKVQARIAQLGENKGSPASFELNIPIFDIRPVDSTARGETARPVTLKIPRDKRYVILGLFSESDRSYPTYSLQLVSNQNEILWNRPGLVRQRQGEISYYTVQLPADQLPPGLYTLSVYGDTNGRHTPVESYRIRVEP